MPQVDYNVANDSGSNVRTDLNDHLAAIAQNNSGATTPATTFAHQQWADTSPSGYSIFQVRNAANAAWATTFDDEGRWKGIAGSASEPSISFGGDTDLGLYRIAANALGIVGTAGVGVGASLPAPDGTLHVHTSSAGTISANANANDLVIENSGNAGITILSGNTGSGILYFGDDGGTTLGSIEYNHNTNHLQFRANNTVRMRIESNGDVGMGTFAQTASAKLEIVSTTGAVLFPRMTTAQRDALTPTNGMMIYNSTTNAFNGYENGAWVDL